MRKTIGPLPLLSGLQTAAAKGTPTGLRACMNVEARDGMVRTRRGTSIVNWSDPSGNRIVSTSAEMGGFAGATFLGMRVLAGADRLLLALTSANLTINGRVFTPGCGVSLCVFLNSQVGPFNTQSATATAEYLSSDGTWKTLTVIDAIAALGARASWSEGYVPFAAPGYVGVAPPMTSTLIGVEKIFFVAPDDWTEQVAHASFPAAYNIRIVWSDTLDVGIPNAVTAYTGTESPPSMAPGLFSVPTRKGERNIVIAGSATGSATAPVRVRISDVFGFDVIPDYQHTYPDMFGPTLSASSVGSFSARLVCQLQTLSSYSPFVSAVYIPHTDDTLVFIDKAIIRLRPDVTRILEDGTTFSTAEQFAPATDDDIDAAYRDIPTEGDLPPARATGYFADRVFIGNFPDAPFDMRWSAPGDAWEAWPSSNHASLGSGSGGEIRAFSSHGGSLYVFTARGVYIATIDEGSGDNESDLFVDFLEETGCVSGKSVVSTSAGIVFLASDGVRIIAGRGPSRPLCPAVSELFRPDSPQQFACIRGAMSCAAWDRVEDVYYLAYPSPGSSNNDTVLVISMANKTAWLWGAPLANVNMDGRLAYVSTGHGAPGSTLQRSRGLRISAMAWSENLQCVLGLSADGLVFRLNPGESSDIGAPIVSSLESQTLQIGSGRQSTVERVDVMALRDHFGAMAVTVIPDGDESRVDTKNVSQQRDRLSSVSAIGSAPMGGQALSPVVDSFAPFRWRGRKKCRNARIRLETVSPTHDPLAIVSVDMEVVKDAGER